MEARNDRNEQFFGREGQRRISATSVGIVGLGGLGSALAQQLAYLGVERFTLVDADVVTVSSLNRLIGSRPSDVGTHKVAVVARTISEAEPQADVTRICRPLESPESFAALRRSAYIFGCVDHDGTRAVLVEFSQAYEIPYFDLASDVDPRSKPMLYGGRVYFTVDSEGCVWCSPPGLDLVEVARYHMSERDREAEARMYGLARSELGGGGPAVVTINSVVASLAATEFMVEVTGLRRAARELQYRAHTGTVSRLAPAAPTGCYYCRAVRGLGDQAELSRYVRRSES